LPGGLKKFMASKSMEYKQIKSLIPSQITGDFDGDGIPDCVIAVKNKKNEQGLVFYLSSTRKTYLLGAGTSFNDWSYLDFGKWQLHSRTERVEAGGEEAGEPPRLIGDALLVVWDEAGSGLIYWDGKGFQWYQQGD